jgi:uncharacterized RDD family membrane protein YckC
MNEQKEPLDVAGTAQKHGDGTEVREITAPRTPVSIDELVITPLVEPPMRRYAGFWVRVWANVIDTIVLTIVSGILVIAFGRGDADTQTVHSLDSFGEILGDLFLTNLLWSMLGLFYFIFMTFRFNQTLGKMALGIEVVRADGQPNQLGNLFFREVIGKALSTIIFLIGYIMVAFDPKKKRFARSHRTDLCCVEVLTLFVLIAFLARFSSSKDGFFLL